MTRLDWQKSSFSGGGNGNCVEVAHGAPGLVHLRESDRPDAVLTATPAIWATFAQGVKAGAFDWPGRDEYRHLQHIADQREEAWLNDLADGAEAEGTAGSVSLEGMAVQLRDHHA